MSLRVLTAVSHSFEARFVTALEQAVGLSVVRRCADLSDLLAAAAAGLADCAIVSADLRALDRDALAHLRDHGVVTVGAVAADDEPGERRLRQLGLTVVVPADAAADELAAILSEAAAEAGLRGRTRTPDRVEPAPGSANSPGQPDRPVDEEADAALPLRGTVVAIWGPAGAPGRTTVATSLAAAFAEADRSVLLIDGDTYGASIAQVLALLDEAPGIAAAARASEQGTLDLPGLARLAPEVLPRLRVLTGIPRSERWPELRPGALEQVFELSRGLAEVVIIDCGFSIEDDEELSYDTAAPRRNASTLTALAQADQLLVVGAADPVGLQRLVRAVQAVGSVPSPTPLVLVNKVRPSSVGQRPQRVIAETLGRFAGMSELTFLPHAWQECDAAMLAGRTVIEHAPGSPLSAAIRELAAGLVPAGGASIRPGRRVITRL